MRLTENLKETIESMHKLKIPRGTRRDCILCAYSCIGKFRLYPQGLNMELDYLINKKASPKQAVEDIKKYFESVRQSTLNFT